mmetsp:Transcript_32000/g.58671  ORF Transcript_32000/g.58671 Transcript_32000/m.58671 type:complete len:216 (+) Transcript_32000:452-1099(+)
MEWPCVARTSSLPASSRISKRCLSLPLTICRKSSTEQSISTNSWTERISDTRQKPSSRICRPRLEAVCRNTRARVFEICTSRNLPPLPLPLPFPLSLPLPFAHPDAPRLSEGLRRCRLRLRLRLPGSGLCFASGSNGGLGLCLDSGSLILAWAWNCRVCASRGSPCCMWLACIATPVTSGAAYAALWAFCCEAIHCACWADACWAAIHCACWAFC